MKFYTGVGSRDTPPEIRTLMCELARGLVRCGYTLRSGGASGADTAFENGAGEYSQIFLPWPGFDGRTADREGVWDTVSDRALKMAAQFHPAWHLCSLGARKLHARNCYQVLGPTLDQPSEFVLCWTAGGQGGGGTGQAIRIAKAHNIRVYDLGSELGLADFLQGGVR